jgi:hypothetical protein
LHGIWMVGCEKGDESMNEEMPSFVFKGEEIMT